MADEQARGTVISKAVELVLALEGEPWGLTVEQVGARLGCSRRHAYRWIEALVDTGHYARLNGRLRRSKKGNP